MKVLITGIGGSGKTSTINKLSQRGFTAIDLDDTGLCYWANKETGDRAQYEKGSGSDWIGKHSFMCDVEGLSKLLKEYDNVFIGGKITKSQISEVVKLFDKFFLIRPNDKVLRNRLLTRTNKRNAFGAESGEAERLVKNRINFEEICISNGATVLLNEGTLSETLEQILKDTKFQ